MRPTPARTLSDIGGDLADDSVLKTRVGEEMKAEFKSHFTLFLLFHNMSTYLSQLPVLPFI